MRIYNKKAHIVFTCARMLSFLGIALVRFAVAVSGSSDLMALPCASVPSPIRIAAITSVNIQQHRLRVTLSILSEDDFKREYADYFAL